MKNIKFTYTKMTFVLGLIFTIVVSCDRELSDEAVFATFPNTAEIFIDAPIGMGTTFYFPFGPDQGNPIGSKLDAWSVDKEVSYEGSASMRIDVPNGNDLDGNYAGAIFIIDGETSGRNLTGYNALTFWGKATQAATINQIGFGQDTYSTLRTDIDFTTNWKKYIIPIPDASKLLRERGMLTYATGGVNGLGFTFWIDEVKFEKLGSVSQPRPIILDGEDVAVQTFTGSEIDLAASGLKPKYNVDGKDIVVVAAPSYFSFISSNTDVAIVDERGVISIIGEGTAEVTAELAGIKAQGLLTITSSGALNPAPVPTRLAANVRSIFSDAYIPATTSNFSPGFGGSTTQTTELGSVGAKVLSYTNNNFTGIIFDSTIDASTLTHLHIDIYTENAGTNVNIQIRDVGANGEIETDVNTGNPIGDDKDKRFDANGLAVGSWTSIDIPLDQGLATQKNNLGAIILAGGPDFILDNIYFYKE
ncbi:glycosyl hydrolase family 16 [Yeosuana marina]|uniref:glycosyl hydrolase family 16 n=1 Tax=Yeosuana marina TaxID=1565536 RepID=UPI0030EDF171